MRVCMRATPRPIPDTCLTLDLPELMHSACCPLQEPNLRATQYLPDIVRLQQYLYDRFHHRLDRKEARRMTIGEFLQSRKHGELATNHV